MAMPRLPSVLLLSAMFVVGFNGAARAEGECNLAMGNPSGAKADPDDKDNFLLLKKQYALAFNNHKGTANWVSWRLRKDDLGDAPRKQFHPDQALTRGFKHITPKDYSDSGFDRGHLCPHGDRSGTPAD